MAITYVGGNSGSGTGTVNIAVPSGLAAGDILLAEFLQDSGTGVTATSWTAVGSTVNTPSNGFPTTVLIYTATGSESGNFTFTPVGGSTIEGALGAYRGVNTTTPLDVTPPTPATGTSGTISYPSITTVSANALNVVISTNFNAIASQPTGYTQRAASADWCVAADAIITTAGTVSGVTSTGGGDWVARSIALRPLLTGPTITAQPTNQTANAGATATFSVTATASAGSLSYQWQDNSTGSFANITGATSSTFTTPTATYSIQGRQYQCIVTDSNGSVTSAVAALLVAFNLAGTGERVTTTFGMPFGAGAFGTFMQGTFSGGGNTYNVSISESGSASDKPSRRAVRRATRRLQLS